MMGNIRAYLYIAKIRLISSLAYRADVVISVISNLIMLLTSVFLWRAVYKGKGTVSGVTETQMVTYAIVSALMGSLMHCSVQDVISQKVVTGEIAMDFLKPMHPLLNWAFDDIGENISRFILNLLPVALLSLLFFRPSPVFTAGSFILFFPAITLSFLILWMMYAVTGTLAFWFMEIGNLGIVQGQVIRLLAGSFIPLWFFPDWVQKISNFLPFQYIAQFPLSICIGRLQEIEIVKGICIQSVWAILIGLTLIIIWKKAQKHVLVQGG